MKLYSMAITRLFGDPQAGARRSRPALDFGLWNQAFHDYVDIRKSLRAVSQVLDGQVGGHRRSSLRYFYNGGRAGVVGGTGYPACNWDVGFW